MGWVVASPTGHRRWRWGVLALVVAVTVGVMALAAPVRLADAQQGGDCGEALHYGHTTSIPGSDGSSLDHLVVADFNGDDHPDVAAAELEGIYHVRVWLNDGPDDDYAPSFTEAPHSPYPIGDEQHDGLAAGLVATDLDGDGNPDLAATSSGGGAHGQGSVEVLLHSGDPAAPFSGAPTSYEVRPDNDEDDARPRDLVAVEATNDGVVDLAVLNKWDDDENRGAVVVLEGHGDGAFTEPDWDPDARATVALDDQRNLVAGDFDDDGDDDLASSARKTNQTGSISVVENTADGLVSLGSHDLKGPDPDGLTAADVTGNGRADVAVGTEGWRPPPGSFDDDDQDQLSVLLGDGDGGLAAPQSYYHRDEEKQVSSADVHGVMPADMDVDGHLDLVTVGGGQGHHSTYQTSWVWLWTGDGNGGFTWSAGCEIGNGHKFSLSNDAVMADFVGNEEATDVMAARRDGLVVLHPPPGALRGRVIEEAGVEGEAEGLEGAEAVDEEMTEPIEGATVTAERVGGWFAWPPVVKNATTDGEGFYPDEAPADSPFGDRWESDRPVVPLVPGFYDVTVEADGYRTETREAVEVVSWDPGQDPTVVDFVLEPVGKIVGTVEDADSGEPLDGVAVTVTPLNDELCEGDEYHEDSEDGKFRVDEVDPCEYRVTGQLDGYESDSAEAVVRDETDYEATVELELEPKPGVITGQVTDAGDGHPIAGAQVAVTSNDGDGGPVDGLTGDDGGEVETGADGRYEVAGLEPGEYQVAADADGYESARVGPVDVEPGDTAEVNLALVPPGDNDPPDNDGPDDEGGGDGGGGDPGGETGGDPGGEAGGDPGGEAGGESGGESAGETGGESAGETGLEPSGDSAGESAGETGGETGGESAGETGLEPSGDSAGESAGETGGESAGETGGESAGETGGEPAGDSATETGGGQAGDSAGESVGETGGESAGEVAAEPTVDAAGEPSIAQAPASEPAPAAAEASAEPAATEPAGDPAAMAPGESGVPGEAAAADQPQASGTGERVRQVAPPVETEGVPVGEDTGWLATATTSSGQPPASAVTVWMAGVALAVTAGWAGRRRRAQPVTPPCALARIPPDPPAGPDGDNLAGHADGGELAWIVRGLR